MRSRLPCFAGCIALALVSVSQASDHFLTLGGGYAPRGNQVSLERNVIYFQHVLEGFGLAKAPHTIMFADGDDPARDLQLSDPNQAAPPINLMLADILGSTEGMDHQYRSHDIPDCHQACRIENIDRYFDDEASKLKDGDRFFLYFTGHGGGSRDKGQQNTIMHLWGGQALTERELTQRLDKVPADVPVVLVMVQCFSGGFANVIFNEGDPAKGLSDRNRVGFFATVYDRYAAGCTSDVNEANYQEYSSYFWAALSGVNRMGQKVDKPDYNHDGHVSFDEAHAYALLTSNSIDVSVKTSDALIRQYSRTSNKDKDKPVDDLFTAETSYSRLLAVASPCEHAVLEGLSKQLKLNGEDRAKDAKRMETEIGAERTGYESRQSNMRKQYDRLREPIARMLRDRWPELSNPWHPQVCFIVHDETEKIIDAIEKHPNYDKMQKLADQMNDLDDRSDELERKQVKLMRFRYACESVALAHNLDKIATPQIVEHYHKLLAAEACTLECAAPAPASAEPVRAKSAKPAGRP
ncbi:MAG: hypothetical protein GC162_06525 [Planctomycetes bacterium]|nr:hypothetical protein [Planctomycetota bacterium]